MTVATVLRPVSNQIGTTLVNDSFDADTIGNVPANWTVEAGTSWQVVAAPSGLSGRAVLCTTDPSFDNNFVRTFTRQTGGIISIGWTLLSNNVLTGRSGSISVFDTSGGVVCQINVLNGAWGYANASGQSGAFAGASWGTTGIYYPTLHINMDTKKYKFQLGATGYDNAGAWYDLTTGTTGIDRIKFSAYSPAGGSYYIDDFQVGTRVPAATPPTTTGTLSTSGSFDGYTLGPDRFGRVVLGYENADVNAANIRMERSANNSTWQDLGGQQQQTVATGSGRWVVIDRRPQYGTESTTFGGNVYYRVGAFNSGGNSPTSASGVLVADVNPAAYYAARSANLSTIMGGSSVPSSAGGEAYPLLWLGAMVFAYAKTVDAGSPVAQYLTDATNEWNYIKTLDNAAHGCVQLADYTDWIYRDHHWRHVLWAAACARILRWVGATALADDMVATADAWVLAFYALNSGSPLTSVTISGFDANNESATNNQQVWAASTAYAQGAIVTPTARNGRTYRVTVAGTSSGTQPTWPTTNGGSVSLNGVTYVETTKTGSITSTVYSTTAPYAPLAGEALIDMNQNGEEAAALALLLTDPNSALFSAGATRTTALAHAADVTALQTVFQTSTGAIPIGQTYPAANGDEGYDTLYGLFTLETGAVIHRFAWTLENTWYPTFLSQGLKWIKASYGTEPVASKHYSGYVPTYASEIHMRRFIAKVLTFSNPLDKVRYSAAVESPATEKPTYDYSANGAADPSTDAHASRSYASDPFIWLHEEIPRLLLPFYIYPSFAGSSWDTIQADPSNISFVVMNDASGHAVALNSDYATEVAQAKAAGLKVIAYIETSYGAEPAATVKTEMGNFRTWYDVDGFFWDEVASDAPNLAYYQDLRNWVDANMAEGKRTVVANHGTNPIEGYAAVADIMVTFEGSAASYASATFSSWQDNYSKSRFCHLIYDAATLTTTLNLAKARRAGHVYITDSTLAGNPWDELPTYWTTLQATVDDPPTAPGVALAGTVVATSTASGALTVRAPLAGTSAVTSVATGSLTGRVALAGTVAAASTATGALTATAAAAGTSAATSTLTGTVTVERALAGTVAAVSTVTGALTVTLPPQLLAPAADSVDGAWTDDAGGTALAAAIDEASASDTDYIRSESAPTASACRIKLAAGTDPASSTGHKIRWRAGKDTTGGPQVDVAVSLYQGGGNTIGGGALIATFARLNVDALTTFEETLSGAEADAITDYGNLYLEFEANQT